jgi:AcrR family transcriptional regulator
MDTRRRLLEAGMEAMESVPLTKVVGASTADIARRAGVTTGSFFHHFASAADFADHVVLELVDQQAGQIETVDELLDALPHLDLLESIRASLREVWAVFSTDDAIRRRLRCQMIMWAHARTPLHEPHPPFEVVGDMLRHNYAELERASVRGWRHLLERTGRTVVEPFTVELLATTLTAVLDGLRIRHDVDPDSVPDELFGEVSAAITAVVTAPRGQRVRIDDVELAGQASRPVSHQARAGARRRRETRRRITAAATGMFERGWEAVSASEVAQRAGVSAQTVVNLYGGVRSVAASTFVRHVPAVREAAEPRASDDPSRALNRTLRALANAAAADPEPARALLGERLAVALRHGDELADMDIRIEVPLADSLLGPLTELAPPDRTPMECATMLVNFVLSQSLVRPEQADLTAATALRLLRDDDGAAPG